MDALLKSNVVYLPNANNIAVIGFTTSASSTLLVGSPVVSVATTGVMGTIGVTHTPIPNAKISDITSWTINIEADGYRSGSSIDPTNIATFSALRNGTVTTKSNETMTAVADLGYGFTATFSDGYYMADGYAIATVTQPKFAETGRWLSIIADQDVYISITSTPVTISETATSGNTQAWLLPANTVLQGVVPPNMWNVTTPNLFYVNLKGVAAGKCRIYMSSE